MKVLYDHQIFSAQIFGGISRYFSELISILSKDPSLSITLPIVNTNNHYLLNSKVITVNNLLHSKRFLGRTSLIRYSTEFITKWSQRMEHHDIFHPTYYNPYFLRNIGNKPFVITVYDMLHEMYPDFFPPDDITTEWKKTTICKATTIIAISENTKRDLIRLYGIGEEKITVIYLASSLGRSMAVPASYKLPSKYLLFVGARKGYKNFKFFIEAMAPVVQQEPELDIICAGGVGFTEEEIVLIASLGIDNRVMQYSVSDEMLATLYMNAVAFVFPSRYEGFGIPVLEAFQCGCPLIASNVSSLPEIAADAAIYFDPTDKESLRNAVEIVIHDRDMRNALVNKGYLRARDFSWEKVAQQTKDLYVKAASYPVNNTN